MKKGMTILYEVHDNLYVNLTNKCSCACTFCLRKNHDTMDGENTLWLEHDVTEAEFLAALEKTDMSKYNELVFCGFGEPTENLDVLLAGAKYMKEKWPNKIRLNTNGQGSLINKRDIVPELKGLIDTISISLNHPDAEKYQEIVKSRYGVESHKAMLDFAKEAAACIPEVVLSTVDTTITHEEEDECRKICEEIGVKYRIRAWEK